MSSSTDHPVGSIKVGYVRRAHGIKGALIARIVDDEVPRFVPGAILATDVQEYPTVTVLSAQSHKEGLLITLDHVTDRNTAETFRGRSFFVADRRELEPDEFWPDQLLGLAAIDAAGTRLGQIAGVVSGEAQDRLVVATDDEDVEVPFVADIVTSIDLDKGAITIDAPDGLF